MFDLFFQSSGSGSVAGSIYDAVVGSSAQVSSGIANYAGISAALFGVTSIPNATIKILRGNWNEYVTLNQPVNLEGSGIGTVITGTLTLAATSSGSMVTGVYMSGTGTIPAFTINVGSVGNYVGFCWQGTTIVPVDNGSTNTVSNFMQVFTYP